MKKYEDDSKNYSNMYYPIDLEYGKYVTTAISNENINNELLEVNSDKVGADYYDYYKSVRDEFLK